ncbi:UNVERIFIED_CONTAM: Bifunctional protein FolD 4, chloroplastic [Sesamum radiatum]|uniref:Bifunctional protein FolD 4, chloroplastic n=1 Tax=Sesamum radiatum TaxID=300843 RepID=A0AAW2KRN6_SESRA
MGKGKILRVKYTTRKKACESVGIKSYEVHLAEESSEQGLLKYISGFNNDPAVVNEFSEYVIRNILQHTNEQSRPSLVVGKRAAVIGRSNIVGMPAAAAAAALLLQIPSAQVVLPRDDRIIQHAPTAFLQIELPQHVTGAAAIKCSTLPFTH